MAETSRGVGEEIADHQGPHRKQALLSASRTEDDTTDRERVSRDAACGMKESTYTGGRLAGLIGEGENRDEPAEQRNG
jgi:hypothetical protein